LPDLWCCFLVCLARSHRGDVMKLRNGRDDLMRPKKRQRVDLVKIDLCWSPREQELKLPAREIKYMPLLDRSRYTGAALWEIRARNGVGRPGSTAMFRSLKIPIRGSWLRRARQAAAMQWRADHV